MEGLMADIVFRIACGMAIVLLTIYAKKEFKETSRRNEQLRRTITGRRSKYNERTPEEKTTEKDR